MDYPFFSGTTIGNAVSLLFVAALWGITNPFIKMGSDGMDKTEHSEGLKLAFMDMVFIFSNWKFLLPFLLNQCGSILYYITIARAEISLVVPLTNSMTFIFTMLTGYFLGEKINKGVTLGVAIVSVGITLCVLGKS